MCGDTQNILITDVRNSERKVACVVLEGRSAKNTPLMSHCCVLISSVLHLCNSTTSVYNFGEIRLQLTHKRPFERRLPTKNARFVCGDGSAGPGFS